MTSKFNPTKELAEELFKIYSKTGTKDEFVKEVLQSHMSLTEYTALIIWHSMNSAWVDGYGTKETEIEETKE